jgi:hypothetical protein
MDHAVNTVLIAWADLLALAGSRALDEVVLEVYQPTRPLANSKRKAGV